MNVLFWMSTSFNTTSRHLLIAIIRELCNSGHSLTLVKKRVDDEEEEIPEELPADQITCFSVPVKSGKKSNLVSRYLRDLCYVRKCRKLLKTSFDAAFLQSSNVAGIMAFMLKKRTKHARLTINVQDIFPYNAVYSGNLRKNSLVFKFFALEQRYAYKKADSIITISEDMKQLLVEDGVEKNKVEVVYNWSYQDAVYDSDNIDKSSVNMFFDHSLFNVVYAGNIGRMQNVEILIEAANLLKSEKDICFHIFGNGVHKASLERLVKDYNLKNVKFWPMQPSPKAPSLYSSADINIIPLVKGVYRTALPSKTATCLACQRPIIFSIGTESEFGKRIQKKTGCPVVDSDDAQALAEKIKSIKNGAYHFKLKEYYTELFGITHNSQLYADMIAKPKEKR